MLQIIHFHDGFSKKGEGHVMELLATSVTK